MQLHQLLDEVSTKGTVLEVKLTPKAASNRLVVEENADGDGWLVRAWVTTVPENGKANAALIKLLAKNSSYAKSDFTIVSGQTSRNKKLTIG